MLLPYVILAIAFLAKAEARLSQVHEVKGQLVAEKLHSGGLLSDVVSSASNKGGQEPSPTPWPERFHAVLLQNRSNRLALVDL